MTACDEYQWNDTTYDTSGTYTWSTTNASGCDSTATLNLTINSHASSSVVARYLHMGMGKYRHHYNRNGILRAHLTNASGCDSVVTLNLTINHPLQL